MCGFCEPAAIRLGLLAGAVLPSWISPVDLLRVESRPRRVSRFTRCEPTARKCGGSHPELRTTNPRPRFLRADDGLLSKAIYPCPVARWTAASRSCAQMDRIGKCLPDVGLNQSGRQTESTSSISFRGAVARNGRAASGSCAGTAPISRACTRLLTLTPG